MIPDRVGRYALLERLGRGSMGEVFKARNETDGALVAVKIMNPALSSDAELVERFRREALSMRVLVHPNIARVFDHGQQGEHLFMVMELLDGRDLGTLIQKAALSLTRKIEIMIECSDGMAFVHACGVVHRDLKPANIHVTNEGRVKIMDFGLARIADSVMTQLGTVMGSPSYMAPEIVMGKKADARSDVFSMGAVFYELLSGRRAFPGKGIHQIMMCVMSGEPEALEETVPGLSPELRGIVETCLRKKPEERYADAGRIHIDLVAAGSR
jgi:serine/threonine protein kinase